MKPTIYHNPRCSKSRQTLALLEDKGIELEVVEYLKDPLEASELRTLVEKLGLPAKAIVRTKEELFKGLTVDLDNDEEVIQALADYPKLLERPIVVKDHKAAIGRPPENVLTIL